MSVLDRLIENPPRRCVIVKVNGEPPLPLLHCYAELLCSVLGEARTVLKEEGVKIVGAYATMGRYDFVVIVEAPDEKAMMKASALIGATGNFTKKTRGPASAGPPVVVSRLAVRVRTGRGTRRSGSPWGKQRQSVRSSPATSSPP